MINKKIMGAIAITFTTSFFALTAFAGELSQRTIQECAAYLNNPTKVAPNPAALKTCYENYACQQNNRLSIIPNCKENLNTWYENETLPKITTMPAQENNVAPTPAPAPGTTIPSEFHSTEPTSAVETPAEPTTEATETTEAQSTSQPENNTTQQNTEEKKEKTPSINWF